MGNYVSSEHGYPVADSGRLAAAPPVEHVGNDGVYCDAIVGG